MTRPVSADTILGLDIAGMTAGTNYDQIVVTGGTVSLAGTTPNSSSTTATRE